MQRFVREQQQSDDGQVIKIIKNEPDAEALTRQPDHQDVRYLDAGTAPVTESESVLSRIALIDERALLSECLSLFLTKTFGATVAKFKSADEFAGNASRDRYGLVITSWSEQSRQMLVSHVERLHQDCGNCPIIVMLDVCDFNLVVDVFKAGARGVLPTTLTSVVTREAVALVVAGGRFIPADSVMPARSPMAEARAPMTSLLTAREAEVLALLKDGKQNKQIAYLLGLSEGTVKVHLHNLMRKLGTTNRTQTILASTAKSDIPSD